MSKHILSTAFVRGRERGAGIPIKELEIRIQDEQARLVPPIDPAQFTGKDALGQAERDAAKSRKLVARNVLAREAGIKPDQAQNALWRDDRDGLIPEIKKGIERVLEPWQTANTTEYLPSPSMLSVLRAVRIPADQAQTAVKALADYPVEVKVGDTSFKADIVVPIPPKDTEATPTDGRRFGVSPKRLTKASKGVSYTHGSRVIERVRLQPTTVGPELRKAANRQARISLVPLDAVSAKPGPFEIPAPKPEGTPTNQQESPKIDIISVPTRSEKVSQALEYFAAKEYRGKTIPGGDSLAQRLTELTQGREVPWAIFNCIMFDLQADGRGYPKFTALRGEGLSIVAFWQESLAQDLDQLSRLGPVKPSIIVPVTELNDGKLWNFTQSISERQELAATIQADLTKQNDTLVTQYGADVVLWDEFCRQQGLKDPEEYTSGQERRILSRPDLMTRVQRQLPRTRTYLEGYIGKPAVDSISDRTILTHSTRYNGMYAGEGEALADIRAIAPNPEERNVITWNNIGADNKLAAPTPFDIDEFYTWRSKEMRARGIGRFARHSK